MEPKNLVIGLVNIILKINFGPNQEKLALDLTNCKKENFLSQLKILRNPLSFIQSLISIKIGQILLLKKEMQ